MIRLMKLNGNFSPDKQHWKTPAQLVERFLQFCADNSYACSIPKLSANENTAMVG
jgi:hypothetical protein